MKLVCVAVLGLLLLACGNQPNPRPTPLVTTAVDVTPLSSYGPISPVVPSISVSTSIDELRMHVIGAPKGSDSYKLCVKGQGIDSESSKNCWKDVSPPSNTVLVAIAFKQACAGNVTITSATLVSNRLTVAAKGPECPVAPAVAAGATPNPKETPTPDIKGARAGSFQLFSIKTSQLVNGSKLNVFLTDETGKILASSPASF